MRLVPDAVRAPRWKAAGILLLFAAFIARLYATHIVYWPLGFDGWAYLEQAASIWRGDGFPLRGEATYLNESLRQWGDRTFSVADYLYPPPLVLLLAPLTALPPPMAIWLWLLLVAASVVFLVMLIRPFAGWTVAVVAVTFFPATWMTLWLGQVNGWIACSWALALLAAHRNRDARAGCWLSAGALLKITPSLGLLIFTARGRWRAIGGAAATAVLIVLASLLVVDLSAWSWGLTVALRRSSDPSNLVSAMAYLYRLPEDFRLVAMASAAFAGLATTLWRARTLPIEFALAGAAFLALVLARITWAHHFVTILPALAVLWAQGPYGRRAAGLLWGCCAFAPYSLLPFASLAGWAVCLWPHQFGIRARE
jgi:alpha-1,2-mannosyltransferase